MKYQKDIARFIKNGDFEVTEEGIIIHGSLRARNRYTHWVNDFEDVQVDYNLIPAAAIADIQNVYWGATAKTSAWYVALIGGNVTPAANWTAANFAANASEITSTTEGYSNATRPLFVPGATGDNTAGVLDNNASPAVFNVVCASTLNVYGLGLLSSNVRGGTSGILSSAVRFTTTRIVQNGDEYKVKFEVELTDS